MSFEIFQDNGIYFLYIDNKFIACYKSYGKAKYQAYHLTKIGA